MAEESLAIGIDFGTSNSCVAVFHHRQMVIIPNEYGNRTTPSCVAFTGTEHVIGETAKILMAINPTSTVSNVKRLIGRRFDDSFVQENMKYWPFQVIDAEGDKVKIKVDQEVFELEKIISMILLKMKQSAEAYLGKTVTNAVIAVPGHFNDSQRRCIVDAGLLIGLHVLRIINESTAVYMAYCDHLFKKDGKIPAKNLLIFDLGGGSLKVSILKGDFGGNVHVTWASENAEIGGEEFDTRMVDHFIVEFKKKHGKDLSTNKKALSRLRTACEQAKKLLSSTSNAPIIIDSLFEGIDFCSSISRSTFEELNADLFRSIIDLVETSFQEAEMTKSQINEIFLVGGSTLIPMIQKLLRDFFDGKEANKIIHPLEAVAHGAAMEAAILNQKQSQLVKELQLSGDNQVEEDDDVDSDEEDESSATVGRVKPIQTARKSCGGFGTGIPIGAAPQFQQRGASAKQFARKNCGGAGMMEATQRAYLRALLPALSRSRKADSCDDDTVQQPENKRLNMSQDIPHDDDLKTL